MLRVVVWLLLAANIAFFAWAEGYLAPIGLAPVIPSEPERLQAQIKPETLRLLNAPKDMAAAPVAPAAAVAPPAAAPAPTDPSPTDPATPAPEPTACWQASGFTTAQANSLRSALPGTGLPSSAWQLNETLQGGRWLVFMGRYSPDQLERKRAELRALGVAFRPVAPPLGPALALGTFSSEEAAQQGLRDAQRKGVRTARVVQEREESRVWTLRLPAVTDAQRAAVAALGTVLAGKKLQDCAG